MVNSGLVTNSNTVVDFDILTKYVAGKTALVAQGGGQRGIFTAGVLDAFLLSNFDPFDEFYGTSAGALNLCAYLCQQPGLGKSFLTELTTDSRFFSLFGFMRRKQALGLDWAFGKLKEYPYKLDIDIGRQVLGERKAYAAVTHNLSFKDAYFEMLKDNWFDVLMATSAIPNLYNGVISLDGQDYVDGGVSASIPVQEAWRRENRTIVVIRTEGLSSESTEPITDAPKVSSNVTWFRESLNQLQIQWQEKVSQWSSDWNSFFDVQVEKAKQQKHEHAHLSALNGGRWLFGSGDIYRLSHLMGEKFDSGFADMLMIHYQTYALTQDFLNMPPDDCYILQIRPDQPLRTSSLLSKKEDILYDYELGLDAGFRFIEAYGQVFANYHRISR